MNTETMTKMLEVFGQLGDGAQTAFVTWVLVTQLSTLAKAILICVTIFVVVRLVARLVASVNENNACLRWSGERMGLDMSGEYLSTDQRIRFKERVVALRKEAAGD